MRASGASADLLIPYLSIAACATPVQQPRYTNEPDPDTIGQIRMSTSISHTKHQVNIYAYTQVPTRRTCGKGTCPEVTSEKEPAFGLIRE